MRLAKYLADAGIASRRKAEELISAGRVKVNGLIVKELGCKVDPRNDVVEFNGQKVTSESKVYVLLNKPAGYISSVSDPQGRPTVTNLLKNLTERVYPVGRLDFDTEGLLILTNDGEFTNLMIHPKYEIDKTYEAWVKGVVNEPALEKLRKGILLEDGFTEPAIVDIIQREPEKTLLSIKIHEGRKRQIKRMCAAIKHPVINLKRTQFGFLKMQGLRLGQYRFLTPQEVKGLVKLAKERAKKANPACGRKRDDN